MMIVTTLFKDVFIVILTSMTML